MFLLDIVCNGLQLTLGTVKHVGDLSVNSLVDLLNELENKEVVILSDLSVALIKTVFEVEVVDLESSAQLSPIGAQLDHLLDHHIHQPQDVNVTRTSKQEVLVQVFP